MVVLEVGIDGQGAIRGSQQVTAAFSRLADSAAFVLSSVSGANSALGGLGAALSRAQPWLVAITAALSGVNALMQAFSQNTKQATDKADEFGRSLREWRNSMSGVLGARAGGGDPLSESMSFLARMKADRSIESVRFGARDPGGAANFVALDDLTRVPGLRQIVLNQAGLTGVSYGPLYDAERNFIGGYDENQALVSRQQVEAGLQEYVNRNYYGGPASNPQFSGGGRYGAGGIGPGYYGPNLNAASPDAGSYSGLGPYLPGTTEDAGVRGGRIKWQNEKDENDALEMQARMADIEAMSRRIGDNLGDAAFDFVAGLRDGRDVMASILIDIGRSLSREAIGSLTKSIISTFG